MTVPITVLHPPHVRGVNKSTNVTTAMNVNVSAIDQSQVHNGAGDVVVDEDAKQHLEQQPSPSSGWMMQVLTPLFQAGV